MVKQINCYKLQGTENQLKEMEECMNCESYETKTFQKYFHIWVFSGLGRCYFPKEQYFVSREDDGFEERNYAIALLKYGSLKETSDNIMHSFAEID